MAKLMKSITLAKSWEGSHVSCGWNRTAQAPWKSSRDQTVASLKAELVCSHCLPNPSLHLSVRDLSEAGRTVLTQIRRRR